METHQRGLELENIPGLQYQIRRVSQGSKLSPQPFAQVALQTPPVISQSVLCHGQVARFSVFWQSYGPEVRLHAGNRTRGHAAATTAVGPCRENIHFGETGEYEA